MKTLNGRNLCAMIVVFLVFASCTASEPVPPPTETPLPPTVAPTEEPTPTATPEPISPWFGVWKTWTGEELTEIEIEFLAKENMLTAEFEPTPGDVHTVSAVISDDEKTARGTWQNSKGASGTMAVRMLEGDVQFIGNLDGYQPLCGVKGDAEQPDPCVLNWGGGWKVWVSKEEIDGTFVYTQTGNVVQGTASYGFLSFLAKGQVSEGGSVITGTWKYGTFEAIMAENMIQFSGNLSGDLICGVRMGGEKPDPCLGSLSE